LFVAAQCDLAIHFFFVFQFCHGKQSRSGTPGKLPMNKRQKSHRMNTIIAAANASMAVCDSVHGFVGSSSNLTAKENWSELNQQHAHKESRQ
jgi:hypothetical protein